MQPSILLADAFDRIRQNANAAVTGLSEDQLVYRPDGGANSIAWLVWHLTRVQDDHISEVANTEQRWISSGWYDKFALDIDDDATGYGDSSDAVAAVRVPADLLVGYLDDVHAATLQYLGQLQDADYERIVDDRWDPPVTLAVRLISVIDDDIQHAGQAAYVRGLVERRR